MILFILRLELELRATREKCKVLKEIRVGDLKPDETVKATQEAQLLSQLHHPAILRFYTSFLERDSFCIVTEFCEHAARLSETVNEFHYPEEDRLHKRVQC
ncbi:serine/threonine-protein kinase Nek11 isoform X3 [Tachysurus ichikawai]